MGFFKSLIKGKTPEKDWSSSGETWRPEWHAQSAQPPSNDDKHPEGPRPTSNNYWDAAPSGPPPQLDNPPPYHEWMTVPDNSMLPPPPQLLNEFSPTNNASYDSAEAARGWCSVNPLYQSATPSQEIYNSVRQGLISFQTPREFQGKFDKSSNGHWHAKSKGGSSQDAIFVAHLPNYFVNIDSPIRTQREFTIYFELRVVKISNDNSGIAIGFVARPYPSWRLPGWNRASVGVHGDDGHRYLNDSYGGRDFVQPFQSGQTVGLGMTFYSALWAGELKGKSKCFFTRNGRIEGEWETDEERDVEREEGPDGLQGEQDIYPAVGCFGSVEFEIVTHREEWMYRPQ